MMISSDKCSSASVLPPAMTKPPTTDPMTMSAPRMTIMRGLQRVVENFRVFLLQQRLDGQDRLRMNLADARFRHPERLRYLPQPHVLKIIKRQHLALHLRQIPQPSLDQRRQFPHRGP